MSRITSLLIALTIMAQAPAGEPADRVNRVDLSVTSEDGLEIFVRRVSSAAADRGPMLLVNGGRPGVLASWDVDVPGPSTAAHLAAAGHVVYLMDARGFGRSEFPDSMQDGAAKGPVAVRSHEVVRDIAAVVDEIRRRHPDDDRLAAVGWATGSQWLGHSAFLERYASLALEGDERAAERDPPWLRVASGPLADTLLTVNGRAVFDASLIRGQVLVLRSGEDFWSRPEDVAAIRTQLTGAKAVEFVELPAASHYVHLLPDERSDAFINAVLAFTGGTYAD